jgi:hypothetical protein
VNGAPSATCSHHPLREAIGICVACRSAMCSDCITKIDGINHCRDCLEKLSRGKAEAPRGKKLRLSPWLAVSVGLVVLTGLSYVMLDVLLPGGPGP